MKPFFLTLILSLLTFNVFGQTKMKITLNNGEVKSGIYKIKDNTLGWATKTKIISKQSKKKYDLKEFKSLMMYIENDSIPYEVIKVKKYADSKETSLKLGQVGLKAKAIELFYVSEYLYQGGAVSNITTVSSYANIYLRKKNQAIAFNMGYIYGAAQRGIKKRARDFFSDCPVLIEKIENNEIPKMETMQIALFYENNCR